MKLASFDIFDTTLIRKCGAPVNIFYLLARRLFPDNEVRVTAFIAWRKQAESMSREKYNCQNVTFDRIYDSFDEKSFGLTRGDAATAEKEMERQNLIVNPVVKEIIERKRAEGYRICFISDMYLDSVFLREVLESQRLILPQEEIFVSCEHDANKSTGQLYPIVKAKYNPARWEHYGDNYHSDYVRARKHGIRAFRIDTAYTPAEEYVKNKYKDHRFFPEISILTGFQRAARIVGGNGSFSELAADFVAPVYIPYVSFVLEQARKHGIGRLYFINRDGYILLKMAEMFAWKYPEIELKYIFISRKSIAGASLVRMDPALLIETLQPQSLIGKRVDGLLHQLSISRQDLQEMGIHFSYDRITNDPEADDFLNKMFRSAYTPVWEERIGKSRELFKQYLDQEGVTEGVKSAMVDLGWYGSTRLMLNRILDHYGFSRIPFFYFSAAHNAIPFRYGEYMVYMPYRLIENSGLMALMEHYFSACPYGTVISYEEVDGKIVPVQGEPNRTAGYGRIVTENMTASGKIVSYLRETSFFDFTPVLDLVAADYLQILREQDIRIDLEACTAIGESPDFDGYGAGLLKKFTLPETLRYALSGSRITAFDRASVTYSYGMGISRKLLFLHEHADRLRRFLYRRYMASRQNSTKHP